VAFTLQIVAQKFVKPAIASLIMSLESVFAALMGWLALGQTLTLRETAGCLVIFAAIIAAQAPDMFSRKKTSEAI
jgi:drug/metabolite transporter (DMT)-like permease